MSMKLTEAGEARVRGYLFVLGRSLRAALPRHVAVDALSEIESHIRERVAQAEALPNEEAALERVLALLGPPLRVAQAYSAEMAVDEALATGGLAATGRAVWRLATMTIRGFFVAVALFAGYAVGASLLITALLKPIFPDNVGLFVRDGIPFAFGVNFPARAGFEVWGGYWVIPIGGFLGLTLLVGTHRAAGRFLAWWRAQRGAWREPAS
jgi:hypothetical protein